MWHGGPYGTYRVDPDGRGATCGLPDSDIDWQRMLAGQVLPLAALLQGIEVLHASAVAIEGTALAITGPSGAGKSTLLHALLARGAGFLADDVAALEIVGDEVRVHPGTAVVNLRESTGERRVDVHAAAAAPLRRLLFLEPVAAGARIAVTKLAPEDPRPLLAASFNRSLLGPQRFALQLDVCSRVAATAQLVRITVPRGAPPGAVLDAASLTPQGIGP